MIKVGDTIQLDFNQTNVLWRVVTIDVSGAWLRSIKHKVPGLVARNDWGKVTIVKTDEDFYKELNNL